MLPLHRMIPRQRSAKEHLKKAFKRLLDVALETGIRPKKDIKKLSDELVQGKLTSLAKKLSDEPTWYAVMLMSILDIEESLLSLMESIKDLRCSVDERVEEQLSLVRDFHRSLTEERSALEKMRPIVVDELPPAIEALNSVIQESRTIIDRVREHEKRIGHLRAILANAQESLSDALKRLDDYLEKMDNIYTVESSIERRLEQATTLLNKIEQDYKRLQEREARLVKQEAVLESRRKAFEDARDEFVKIREQLKYSKKAIDDLIDTGRQCTRELSERLTDIKSTLANLSNHLGQMRRYLTELDIKHKRVVEKESELKAKEEILNQRIALAEETKSKLENILDRVSKAHEQVGLLLKSVEEHMGNLEQFIKSIQSTLTENAQKLAFRADDVLKLLKNLKSEQESLAKLESKYIGLEEEKARVTKLRQILEDRIKQLENGIKKLEVYAQNLNHISRDVKSHFDKASEAYKSLSNGISTLDGILNELRDIKSDIERQLDDLIEQRKAIEKRMEELKKQEMALRQLKNECGLLMSSAEDVEKKLEDIRKEKKALRDFRKRIETSLSIIESRLAALDGRIKQYDEEINMYQRRLSWLDSIDEKVKELEEQKRTLEAEKRELEAEIGELRSRRDELRKELEELENTLENKRKILEELRSALRSELSRATER